MKFGIITLVSDNYGNKYQNYAVEQLLSKYGEVETFGLEPLYHLDDMEQNGIFHKLNPKYVRDVLTYRTMYVYDINRVDRGVLRNFIFSKINRGKLIELKEKRSRRFAAFSNQFLHISEIKLNKENTGLDWSDQYDYFICGSDQIWNPSYSTTSELAFCSFAPEKTICLAPSFGVSRIPDSRKQEYAVYLKRLKHLSVREDAGQRIIDELTGRKAEVLIDPTMAVPAQTWETVLKKPGNQLPKKYVACYFLGRIDKKYKKRIDSFAAEKGLQIVMLFDITTPQYYSLDPAEVLYTIKHADYVLTDSFHGSVFSILFHKNFTVFERDESDNSMYSRIETLLRKFKLEDRSQGQSSIIDAKRWITVDDILDDERSKTKKYLLNAINATLIKERT